MQKTITAAALAAIMAAVAPAAFAAGSSAGTSGSTDSTGTLSSPETTTGTSGTLGRTDSTTGTGMSGSGTSGTLGTTGAGSSGSGTSGTLGTTGTGATGAMGSTTTPGMTATATEMQPGQVRGSDLKGADVHNMQDERIASVKDLVIDREGRVARVVVEIEGKDVGLEMRELNISTNEQGKPHITVSKTEEELRAAQEFDLEAPTATGTTMPGSTTPGSTPTPGSTTMPPAGNGNR